MENNFDKYFKEKFENRAFEMKPEFWDEAESMIEADEQKRNWRRFLFWGSLALLIAVISFSIWRSGQSVATTSNEVNSSISISKNENSNTTTNSSETQNTEENINTNHSKLNEFLKDKNSKNNKIKDNQNLGNELLQNSISSSNFSKSESKQENISNTLRSNSIEKNESNNSSNNLQFDISVGNTNKNNNENTTLKKPNNQINTPPISPTDNSTTTNANTKSSTNKNTPTSNEIINSSLKTKPIAESVIFIPLLQQLLPTKRIKDIDIDPVWPAKTPKGNFSFGILAGAVGYPLIENGDQQPFIGFKTGLLLEYNLNEKWSLGTEILYSYRSGNFVATQQNELLQYSFGRSATINQLTPKDLHYLELPIYGKYHLKKMSFEAGASINYLMGARGIVNYNNEITEGWIQKTGFKNYHANILLGFQYGWSENFKFGLRANYTPSGILDTTVNLPFGKPLKESGPLHLTFRVTQYFK